MIHIIRRKRKMKNSKLLRNEINRSVFNRGMFLSVTISAVLVLLFCKNHLKMWVEYEVAETFYEPIIRGTPLCGWIISTGSQYMYYLYYMLAFLAVLPYGMSFLSDIRSGVIKNIFVRVKRGTYATYRFVATFIAGGIALIIAPMISLIINMNYAPIQKVLPGILTLQSITWLEKLLFTHPILYVLLYMGMYFMLGGVLANLSILISMISKNRLTVFLTPFFVMLFVIYIQQRLMIMGVGSDVIKYFPFTFMFCFSIRGGMEIIMGGLLVIAAVEYIVFRHRVCRMEVM